MKLVNRVPTIRARQQCIYTRRFENSGRVLQCQLQAGHSPVGSEDGCWYVPFRAYGRSYGGRWSPVPEVPWYRGRDLVTVVR